MSTSTTLASRPPCYQVGNLSSLPIVPWRNVYPCITVHNDANHWHTKLHQHIFHLDIPDNKSHKVYSSMKYLIIVCNNYIHAKHFPVFNTFHYENFHTFKWHILTTCHGKDTSSKLLKKEQGRIIICHVINFVLHLFQIIRCSGFSRPVFQHYFSSTFQRRNNVFLSQQISTSDIQISVK